MTTRIYKRASHNKGKHSAINYRDVTLEQGRIYCRP